MLVNAKKLLLVCHLLCNGFFGFILTQAVIIKLMTTSHPLGENFVSDFSKDSQAEANDKIVIDKVLVNKLTELLINSI
jgi:hypothetical protein